MSDIAEICWTDVLLGSDVDFQLSEKARLIMQRQVELAGALQRLKRAKDEMEYFVLVAGDEHERHLLEIEIDEAQRQVQHAQQEVQWAQGELPT